MRWRPTLAALGILAVAGVLLGTLSSASSPSVLDSGSETVSQDLSAVAANGGATPVAAGIDPTSRHDGDSGPSGPVAASGPNGGDPAASGSAEFPVTPAGMSDDSSLIDSPTQPDSIPAICPESSDPLFSLYTVGVDCYWLLIVDEEHRELTEEERELIEASPPVAEPASEPLGRPARKIVRGPAGQPGEPRLYLTFDDGPSPSWTRPTLDLLDRYGARATFFPVGAYASLNFDLIQEIRARGHTIGVHLWSHDQAALYNEDLFRQELRASAELFGNLGTNCLRTPYGITSEEIFEWAGEEGFEVVLWADVDPLDWQHPGIDKLTQRILQGVRPGTILLLHERTGSNTLAALDAVLSALDAAGWRFDEPICPLKF